MRRVKRRNLFPPGVGRDHTRELRQEGKEKGSKIKLARGMEGRALSEMEMKPQRYFQGMSEAITFGRKGEDRWMVGDGKEPCTGEPGGEFLRRLYWGPCSFRTREGKVRDRWLRGNP